MATVNLTIGIQAVAGPQLNVVRPLEVQAYDKVEVTVNPGGAAAAETSIDIQPSGAGKVVFLAINSTVLGAEIVYKASDGAADSDAVQLTTPQLYLGNSISLLGVAPKLLKIKNTFPANDSTKKATVEIFVGRQAV
jgi:hypothetical protein